jgi:endoglucanase
MTTTWLFQEPLHDSNVIYNFHFYEPHIFTHQGATWSAYYWHWLRGLRYPSSPESAERAAALVPDEVDRLQVIRYGYEHWDGARIEAEMKQAAQWARRRGVPLVCNEFGVYREYADPGGPGDVVARCADRARAQRDWVGDVGLFGIVWRGHEEGWQDGSG